jgi:hypothetical protein
MDIMECGKERLKLSDRVEELKSLLEELGDMARTIYEEEAIKKQIELSRKQILLAMLFGVSSDFSSFCFSIDNRFPHIPLLRALVLYWEMAQEKGWINGNLTAPQFCGELFVR